MSSPSPSCDLKCGMNDLPTEIKARIVELCAEQDERFQRWLTTRPTVAADLKKHGLMYGRSVSALFRVSKQFSELAAPFLFKILKSSKIDLRFNYAVAPRRLPLFQQIVLEATTRQRNSDQLLPVLPRLTRAKKLTLHGQAFADLWDANDVSLDFVSLQSSKALYAALSLRTLSGITELSVDNVRSHSYKEIIPTFSSTLRVLRICTLPMYGSVPVKDLAAGLSSAPHLEELDLRLISESPEHLFVDLTTTQRNLKTPLALRHLSLTVNLLHSSHLPFITLFSATLQSLSLDCMSGSEVIPQGYSPPAFSSEVFPVLTTLSVTGEDDAVWDTLASIEPSHLPSLAHLELTLFDVPDWADPDSSPLTRFALFPHLTCLTVGVFHGLSYDNKLAILDFAEQNGLELKDREGKTIPPLPAIAASPTSDAAVSSSEDEGDYEDEGPLIPDAEVERFLKTLAYVRKKGKEAVEGGDEATLSRLEGALEGMELQRQGDEAWEGA
ncbi:hypothetical protein JCM6882_001462 [Rhodosporidiobolus microsporus]